MAIREHSEKELRNKLNSRGFNAELISQVLEELQTEGLLSDSRFTEAFITYRTNRGYGPVRIKQELRERGIADEIMEQCFEALEVDWMEQLKIVKEKKYGEDMPTDYKEQARQSRFLQSRGFSSGQIHSLFRSTE